MKPIRILIAAMVCVVCTTARGDDFYKGKVVSIISGGSGGYDTYARILGRYLGRYIPGEPTVIVKSMQGAASMAAANSVYNVSAPDGLTFGGFLRQIPFAPLFNDPAVRFDPQKFTWIGTSTSFLNDVSLLFVHKRRGIRSVAELQASKTPLQFGSVGRTSTGDEGARLTGQVLGLPIKIVRGYTGVPQILLAMEAGELDAMILGISSLSSTKPEWLAPDAPLNFLFQFGYGGDGRHPRFPDVPRIDELVTSDSDKAIFELLQLPFKIASPFGGPPGIPAERARILRDAFDRVHKDPAYLAEAEKLRVDVSPRTGSDVADVVSKAYTLPKDLVARYSDILTRSD